MADKSYAQLDKYYMVILEQKMNSMLDLQNHVCTATRCRMAAGNLGLFLGSVFQNGWVVEEGWVMSHLCCRNF